MAIDWGSAGLNIDMNAPKSPLQAGMEGFAMGQKINSQSLANEQQAMMNKETPALLELQKATAEGKISLDQIESAKKSYELGQAMMQPIALAIQQGDMNSAKEMYDQTRDRLSQSGMDPSKLGIPEKFNPQWLQSTFANNAAQLEMMEKLTGIQKNQSYINRNNTAAQKDIFDMGGNPASVPGGFTFPGQVPAAGGQPGIPGAPQLGLKQQQEVDAARAKAFQEMRAKNNAAAAKARSSLGVINEARNLLDTTSGKLGTGPIAGILGQYGSENVQRLESLYNSMVTGLLQSDYAGQGMGALDVVVFNSLKSTLPTTRQSPSVQKQGLDQAEAAAKGLQLVSDIGEKVNQLGIQDDATRAAIGNKIAERLNLKDGSKFNLNNFQNADKVTAEVLKEYTMKGAEALTSKNLKPNESSSLDMELANLGLNAQQIADYKARIKKR
jgi:hypothetical protein